MDFIIDEERNKYLEQQKDLQSKVNPKPYSVEEIERKLQELKDARNKRSSRNENHSEY